MTDVPVELIVAAFQDEKSADEALKLLKEARKEGLISIQNAAVLRKDEKGKLHIKETADMGGKKGAALGGVAGAAIGLLAGPALIVPVAVGALVGGLAAKLRDSGFDDKQLKDISESLKPGSSAIIAVVEHTWVAEVQKAMDQAGAEMIKTELKADIASQLEAGHEVAYSVLVSQQGVVASRAAGNEEEFESGKLMVTEEGVSGEKYVVTKDGFAVIAAQEDAGGLTVAGATGTFSPKTEEAESSEKTE
jgi:uncharacterized membrane protein